MDLDRPDRQRRLDLLAAEYALGTLSGRARRRLDRAARASPAVAQSIGDWEARLAGLAAALPGVTPAPRVWEGIARRLGLSGAAAAPTPWWSGLALWRGLAIAGFAAAVALGIAQFGTKPEAPEALVVVLAGPDARPALIASVARGERLLRVKALAPVAVPPDRALELWMLPGQGNPRSLGLIPASGVGQVRLAAPADVAFRDIGALAISLEPAGGSPTGLPTGPVLYSGKIERL